MHVVHMYLQEINESAIDAASAYVILFAVDVMTSFSSAKELAEQCKRQHGNKAAIVMVANKTDLVRRKVVSSNGAFRLCI